MTSVHGLEAIRNLGPLDGDSLAENPILVSKLALEMYLVSGSCLPLAVNVSANDLNGGTVEYRDNATLSAEVGSSLGGSGVRERSSSGWIG
jgi:hypothetical protein